MPHMLPGSTSICKLGRPDCQPQGRLAVMSYHSLEDGLVKHRFRQLAEGEDFNLVTKRPLTPSDAEIKNNPRARSAKLRILERTEI